MASNRDINGMEARNWKDANLASIISEKVTSKDDNIKLFDAIKNIVAAAVVELRGDSADDKYRYIVDLIMMRVRAAIENANTENNEQLIKSIKNSISNIIENNQNLLDNIATNVYNQIKTDENFSLSDNVLKQIVDSVLENIQNFDQDNSDTKDNINKEKEEKHQTDEEKEKKTDKQASEKKDEKKQFEKITTELNINIEKLEKLLEQNIDAINSTISSSQNTKNTLTNKQYKLFIKLVTSELRKINYILLDANEQLKEQFNITNQNITKVYDYLVKKDKKFNIADILLTVSILGGILVAMFWDKIKEKLAEWFPSADKFLDLVKNLYNQIPWNNILSKAISKLFVVVKDAFFNFITSPMDYIINSIKETWNNLKEFASDVWNWITGKTKELKDEQNSNELKAEKNVEMKMNDSIDRLDKNLADRATSLTADCDKSIQQQNNALTDTTNMVNNATNELNNTVSQDVEALQKTANNTTQQIEQTTLPSIENSVSKSSETQIGNLNSKLSEQMSETEKKLNDNIDNIDETIKKNGAPTDIDKTALDELQKNSNSDGNIDQPIDQKIKMPSNVVESTVKEQNKNVNLYSNKADIAEVKRNEQEVANIQEQFVPAVDNNSTANSANKAKLEQKLIIKGPNGEQLDTASIDKKIADFNSIVEALSKTEQDTKNNNAELTNIKKDVNIYLDTLNGCVKNIIDLNKNKKNQNMLVVANSNSTSEAGIEDI